MRSVLALLLFIALAGPGPGPRAEAEEYVWIGWYGPEWSTAAWGHEWTYDNHTYFNGWGKEWGWTEDNILFFPDSSDSVLIPAGAGVNVDGGVTARCGTLTVAEGASLGILVSSVDIYGGELHNDGHMVLTNYTAAIGHINVRAPLAITGTGDLELAVGRFQADAPFELTVGPEQTIHGGGQFGWEPYGNYHGVYLTNHGTVTATNSLTPLDILGMAVDNDGTASAGNGATLRVWGDWTNHGGELLAEDGGLVDLMGGAGHPARVRGGTLRTEGSGRIRPEGEASLADLTLEGVLDIRRYFGVHMSNTITNNGTIEQGTGGTFGYAHVQIDSALTFLGDGILRMGDGNALHMYNWPDHNAVLTNGPDHTIECLGGDFGTDPDYYGDRRIELVNEGTLICGEAPGHNRFRLAGAGFENRGQLILEPTASNGTYLYGEFVQTAGTTRVDDAFVASGGQFTFRGGRLEGTGYLQGAVAVSDSAAIDPGRKLEPGTLTIHGPLSLADGATLVCDWAHNAEDLLVVNGAVTAAGNLTLRLEYLAPDKSMDLVVLSALDHDDTATWTVELPDGWAHSSLEWVGHDLVLRGLTGFVADVGEVAPTAAGLCAAPNPFNPRTTISYELAEDGPVTLWIADLAGRRLHTLVKEARPAGRHTVVWNGRDDRGRALASGAYIVVLHTRGEVRTSRMTLVR